MTASAGPGASRATDRAPAGPFRDRRSRRTAAWWLVGLLLGGFLLYWPGLWIAYYADDFQWYFDPPPSSVLHHFSHRNESQHNAYRPVQAAYMALVQRHFGLGTLPIHVAALTLHCGLSWLVYVSLSGRGLPTLHAGLGGGLMLVSQANVFAVASTDTLSQVAGTAFGCASLWLLAQGPGAPGGPAATTSRAAGWSAYSLSVLCFALALLSKETSAPFGAMAVLVILAGWRHRRPGRLAAQAAPFVLVMGAYLGVRAQLEISRFTFGTDRYDLNLGVVNVAKNLGLFAFQSVLPISSVTAFESLRAGAGASGLAIVAAAGAVAAVLVAGIWKRRTDPYVLWLAGFSILALFPVVLMNRVSELYLYNATPFVSALLGIALGDAARGVLARPRGLWAAFVVALFAAHIGAVRTKVDQMRDCGDRASALLAGLAPLLPEVPAGGVLVLVNPPGPPPEYAVFTMWGFNTLRTGTVRLEQMSRRSDFEIRIVDQAEVEKERAAAAAKHQPIVLVEASRDGREVHRLD